MSNATAIALIMANFLPGLFVYHYITKLANDLGAEIETGVVQGIPISTRYRRILLYQTWVGYVLAAFACGIFAAILNTRIACQVDDVDIKALAYVAAAIGGVGALALAANCVLEITHYRSCIRQAEGN